TSCVRSTLASAVSGSVVRPSLPALSGGRWPIGCYAIGCDRVRSELPTGSSDADDPCFGGHDRGHQRMVLGGTASVVRWRGVDLRRYSVHAGRDHADERKTPRSWTRSGLGSGVSALAGTGENCTPFGVFLPSGLQLFFCQW